MSCLNIKILPDIINFSNDTKIPHDWAFLEQPSVLNVKYTNKFTLSAKHVSPNEIAVDKDNSIELEAFIQRQDRLRNISIKDYFNFDPK